MPTRTVVVGSAVGLHARPAAIISEAAGELDSEVLIAIPGDEGVDASSAVAKRLGMRLEGVLRESFPHRGRAEDVEVWALLASER